MRVADVIAQRLARFTRFAFGVPGGEVLTMIDALRAADIRFVVARQESAAGFMAEGTQRVTGGVGLLVATIGPGVANTINVASHAQQARRPMIILTGCVDAADSGSYTHQVFDHQAVLRPLVKGSFRIAAQTAGEVIDRALLLAVEGSPGPVHVEIPVAVADEQVEASPIVETVLPPPRATAIGVLRDALKSAERPLLLGGLELLGGFEPPGRGSDALHRIVQSYALPVLTTYEAKGVLDEHHSSSLGGVGLSPKADALALPLVREADVVVLAGYDPVEVRHGWRNPFHPDAMVIDCTRRAGQHGMHSASYVLQGDPASTLEALFEGLERNALWPRAAEVRRRLADAFKPDATWGPSGIFGVLEELLAPETWLAVDTGAHRILLCQQWRFTHPGRLIQSNGTSTMACALPFAIGAKLAAPDEPVACIVGDGGFEMGLGDLGTLRDLGLSMPIFVIDDRSLALIEKKQRSRELTNVGVDFGADGRDFPGTDYAAIAEAFGGHGVRVESLDALRRETEASLSREGFTLIHCPIDRRAYDGRI